MLSKNKRIESFTESDIASIKKHMKYLLDVYNNRNTSKLSSRGLLEIKFESDMRFSIVQKTYGKSYLYFKGTFINNKGLFINGDFRIGNYFKIQLFFILPLFFAGLIFYDPIQSNQLLFFIGLGLLVLAYSLFTIKNLWKSIDRFIDNM